MIVLAMLFDVRLIGCSLGSPPFERTPVSAAHTPAKFRLRSAEGGTERAIATVRTARLAKIPEVHELLYRV